MKKILFCALISLSLSFYASASYVGDSITVSGVPGFSSPSVAVNQSSVEIVQGNPSGSVIKFYCGETTTSSFICGFIQTSTPYFSIDITELSSGNLQIDVALNDTLDNALAVTLADFDSPSHSIAGISLLSQSPHLASFVDPSTGILISPQPGSATLGIVSLSSILQFGFSENSLYFDLPSGAYSNDFSLLVETTTVPIPASIGLFGSALVGLLGLKLKRNS